MAKAGRCRVDLSRKPGIISSKARSQKHSRLLGASSGSRFESFGMYDHQSRHEPGLLSLIYVLQDRFREWDGAEAHPQSTTVREDHLDQCAHRLRPSILYACTAKE